MWTLCHTVNNETKAWQDDNHFITNKITKEEGDKDIIFPHEWNHAIFGTKQMSGSTTQSHIVMKVKENSLYSDQNLTKAVTKDLKKAKSGLTSPFTEFLDVLSHDSLHRIQNKSEISLGKWT